MLHAVANFPAVNGRFLAAEGKVTQSDATSPQSPSYS